MLFLPMCDNFSFHYVTLIAIILYINDKSGSQGCYIDFMDFQFFHSRLNQTAFSFFTATSL
jgi:hypothetical protein